MRATHASVLWKADTTVGRELACFDLANCCFDETAVFTPLLITDGCFQILNLRNTLSNEDDQCHILDPTNPRIADHLRVERQQPFWAFRVTARRGFPVNQTLRAVEFSD